jgi:hypothetical protein
MRNCKIVPTEKCTQCNMCEPCIKLNGEAAENLVKLFDKYEKEYSEKYIKHSEQK